MNIIESIKNDKDLHIALITDTIEDLKNQNKFIKKILVFCIVIILNLIIGIVGLSVYHNERLISLIENTEFETITENFIETDNNSSNYGDINISKE